MNDLLSGEIVAQLELDPYEDLGQDRTHCLAAYEAGKEAVLLSGHGAGLVYVWDLHAEKSIKRIGISGSEIRQIEVVEVNGRRYVVCAALGRTITILDGDTLDPRYQIQDHTKPDHLPSIATGALGAERVLYSANDSGISVYSLLAGRS